MSESRLLAFAEKITSIEDNLDCCGDNFLLSIIKNFVGKHPNSKVDILSRRSTFESSASYQKSEFLKYTTQSLGLEVGQAFLDSLDNFEVNGENHLLILPSANDWIEDDSLEAEARSINDFSRSIFSLTLKRATILVEIHNDLLYSAAVLDKLRSITSTYYKLDSDDYGRAICRSTVRKAQGKPILKVEYISIDPESLEIKFSPVPKRTKETKENQAEDTKAGVKVPFKLGISEKEKASKEAVTLPYTKIQNTGQESMFVGIHEQQKSGKVLYTADAEDDLDDSDPDDDLNV